jgi:hypothetical protein
LKTKQHHCGAKEDGAYRKYPYRRNPAAKSISNDKVYGNKSLFLLFLIIIIIIVIIITKYLFGRCWLVRRRPACWDWTRQLT